MRCVDEFNRDRITLETYMQGAEVAAPPQGRRYRSTEASTERAGLPETKIQSDLGPLGPVG